MVLQNFNIYCSLLFLLPCTGIASGLPIDLRPTLHITVVRVCTTQNVVCSIGIDVEEPDISKKLCPCYVYTTQLKCLQKKRWFACINITFEIFILECLHGLKDCRFHIYLQGNILVPYIFECMANCS